MTDAILYSIHREYTDEIFNGDKTLEMRKRAPKGLSYPYIALIYETKKNGGAGAVVGFFTCPCTITTNAFESRLYAQTAAAYRADIAKRARLTEEQLEEYANRGKLDGVVISNPTRFPKPRPLSDFGLSRPPQSWQRIKIDTDIKL